MSADNLRLWRVEVTYDVVVVAASASEALRAAVTSQAESEPDCIAHEVDTLGELGGFAPDSIPYGEQDEADPDRTAGRWIELLAQRREAERLRALHEAEQPRLFPEEAP